MSPPPPPRPEGESASTFRSRAVTWAHPDQPRVSEPTPSTIALAALHVQDAVEGRLQHGHASMSQASRSVRLMFVVHSSSVFSWLINAANLLHLSFTWLEEDAELIGPGALLMAEIACICAYGVDIGLKAGYMGRAHYLDKSQHRGLVLLVSIFAAATVR